MTEPVRVLSGEEKALLAGSRFRDLNLDFVDLATADLRHARFERVSLVGCDFTAADLRSTEFYDCDLRGAAFERAQWQNNIFYGCLFHGARGLDLIRTYYIQIRGGSFFPLEPVER
jgi:uncharacterized protein YjbI with pentapeptide repeats